MFIARLLTLLFLTAYSWSMGQLPASDLNGFGKIAASLFFIFAPAAYLLPTFEAWWGDRPNLTAIAAVNILAGWTLVGWVVAVAWALKAPDAEAVASAGPEDESDMKSCAFCAESIRAAAIKCKHCGSAVILPAAEAAE